MSTMLVDLDDLLGQWAKDDLRSAFVAGAAWWEYHREGATIWQSERNLAEVEAENRYPDGEPRIKGEFR